MDPEPKTHIGKVCPHCQSSWYRKRTDKATGKGVKGFKVSIYYVCNKCKKTFLSPRTAVIRDTKSKVPTLKGILDRKLAEKLSNT
jgi:hypothetical protein